MYFWSELVLEEMFQMTTEYSLQQIEEFDRDWTDRFAADRGWEKHFLSNPVEDLKLFFDNLTGKYILDSGCGWGRYVHLFIDAGLEYVGLDHSCEMLLVANASNPGLKFVQATFSKIPFPDEHFDGIWSCCSLAAVPKKHLGEILSEHKRVLKSEGIMMIVMPAFEWHESEEMMHTDADGNPTIYQAHYELREFCRHAENAGLEIIYADYRWHTGSMFVLAKNVS